MKLFKILGAAAFLLWPAAAFATPLTKLPIPLPGEASPPMVQFVQLTDPRIAQLEEQVRQLNGLVEELNFQVLQMQDQLRRLQEDNEFRFQQLEERRSDAGAAPSRQQAESGSIEEIIETPDGVLTQAPDGTQQRGEPPRNFGRIIFDAQGNVVGAAPGEGSLPGVQTGPGGPDDTTVAALPPADSAGELYDNAYQFILSGDYDTAEAGFRELIERFPDDQRAADSHFWLGEALLAQGRHRDAAQTFLAANRDFPDSRKAPETMLKLGISLAAMNQRDVACATFAEIPRRYPDASAVVELARQEQGRASC